jgi:hypothetical protein
MGRKGICMMDMKSNREELGEILKLMGTAVKHSWRRDEALTTLYLELAKAKADILMGKI